MATKYNGGQGHHFLIVIAAAQGHINPARHLARRLATTAGARVTIATPLSSYRRLFSRRPPTPAGEPNDTVQEAPLNPNGSGVVAYSPYSDGFDDVKSHLSNIDASLFMERLKSFGTRTLTTLAHNCTAMGHPVTCMLYTNILAWATDVARDLAVPAIHYWIQPASVFAVYYHYFHGHPSLLTPASCVGKDSSFSIQLPNLPPLRMKDLPSFITKPDAYLSAHMDIFKELEKSEKKPMVLMNTFHELEAAVIDGIRGLELVTIGPIASCMREGLGGRDLFEEDEGGYMEWLDAKEERSVVYVAFGSLTKLTGRQIKELRMGLNESRRPYLWALRKDGRAEGEEEVEMVLKEGEGMVVEWCSQVGVLDHKAVGCFVTHCGWNSVSEAVMGGVPMVMLPQSVEQMTNARMAEAAWGIGVVVEAGRAAEDGIVEAADVRRGVEGVMGEGEAAVEIRRKAEMWKEKARAAVAEDGSSTKNLRAFVNSLCK